MIDFVWHNCKGKQGFQKYTYQKLSNELQEYAAHFLMMSTQELVEWAKTCHPKVFIHAYDSTWRKFYEACTTAWTFGNYSRFLYQGPSFISYPGCSTEADRNKS